MSKKSLLLLILLWIVISVFIIQYTYAKYVSGVTTNTSIGVSNWDLTINNYNVINNSDFSQNLSLVFPGGTYYNANCVVPGAIGYFDITIDATNVTLPFRYTVTSSFASGNNIQDMEIVGYSTDGGNTITNLSNAVPTASTIVAANATSSSMRVYVQWVDGGQNEIMNDIVDTNVAKTQGKTVISATVTFEQRV